MEKFLIDVNLPYYFNLWNNPNYVHQADICVTSTDEEIWNYARFHKLTIISKDSDFSNRIILSEPPPKIIHIRLGNLKIKEFYAVMNRIWDDVLKLNQSFKLINVYSDRIEGIN